VWIGHQRFIYNAKVKEQDYFNRFARISLTLTGMKPLPDQAYSQFISEDTAFLKQVPSQLLRNGAYRFATGNARMLKGLGGAPTIKKKYGRQSVLVTSELFNFADHTEAATGEIRHHLLLGTKTRPLGRLNFKAHRAYAVPKMLSISVEADGRWFVSFCFEKPVAANDLPFFLRSPEELAYEFGLRSDLADITVGIDRGVKIPLATSDGQALVVAAVNVQRIEDKEVRIKRFQRRMARQQLGSKNRNKTRQRIARLKGYGAEVRKDFAHKASHALVTSSAQVFVLEDLKLKNMTAAPAPRKDTQGRYTANGAAAKAGLNKAILSSALGLVKELITYKAAERNKLVLKVSPYNSSNECAECGHTAPENRPRQAEFCCVKCAHTDNADVNAARVIKQRGIALLVAHKVVFKQKKTARVRGKDKTRVVESTVGPVRPEPGSLSCPTPVENMSDDLVSSAANAATFAETGNRHLNAARR
jgi:putative transposase